MAGSTGERRDPWLRGELTEGENQPSWAERASGPPAFPWRKAGGRGPRVLFSIKKRCVRVCVIVWQVSWSLVSLRVRLSVQGKREYKVWQERLLCWGGGTPGRCPVPRTEPAAVHRALLDAIPASTRFL